MIVGVPLHPSVGFTPAPSLNPPLTLDYSLQTLHPRNNPSDIQSFYKCCKLPSTTATREMMQYSLGVTVCNILAL